MVRILAVILAAALISVGPSIFAAGAAFESVVPIQEIRTDPETEASVLVNVCAATNINTKERYWLTAEHCVHDPHTTSYILGEAVKVKMRDVVNDIAILQTLDKTAPAVKMATKPLALGDSVTVISYPGGTPFPLLFNGTVANARVDLEYPQVFFQTVGAPGSSGSPVFDAEGNLVSIVQRAPNQRGYSPAMSGVHFDKIAVLTTWWEK